MSLFQPPTDNLYKFLAIAGLLLFGFSLIFPALQLRELRDKQIQLVGERQVLNVEQSYWEAMSDVELGNNKIMLEAIQSLRNEPDFMKQDKAYIDYINNELNRGRERNEQLKEKSKLLFIREAEINTKNELLKAVDFDITFMRWLGVVTALIASCFASYGFRLWYRRVQAPQDFILANQASLESEKQTAPAPLETGPAPIENASVEAQPVESPVEEGKPIQPSS